MDSTKDTYDSIRKYCRSLRGLVMVTTKQPYTERRLVKAPQPLFKGPIIIDYLGMV